MINIVLHIQELWSPKNENFHVLKLLKAEGLPTLFYTSKNCCERVSKQVRGITNIVLHLEELFGNGVQAKVQRCALVKKT